MADILPRVEIYAFARRDWRYRYFDAEGNMTDSGPLRGVNGHPSAVFRPVNASYPGVPILIVEAPEEA